MKVEAYEAIDGTLHRSKAELVEHEIRCLAGSDTREMSMTDQFIAVLSNDVSFRNVVRDWLDVLK
jgi:hypothetical protein